MGIEEAARILESQQLCLVDVDPTRSLGTGGRRKVYVNSEFWDTGINREDSHSLMSWACRKGSENKFDSLDLKSSETQRYGTCRVLVVFVRS